MNSREKKAKQPKKSKQSRRRGGINYVDDNSILEDLDHQDDHQNPQNIPPDLAGDLVQEGSQKRLLNYLDQLGDSSSKKRTTAFADMSLLLAGENFTQWIFENRVPIIESILTAFQTKKPTSHEQHNAIRVLMLVFLAIGHDNIENLYNMIKPLLFASINKSKSFKICTEIFPQLILAASSCTLIGNQDPYITTTFLDALASKIKSLAPEESYQLSSQYQTDDTSESSSSESDSDEDTYDYEDITYDEEGNVIFPDHSEQNGTTGTQQDTNVGDQETSYSISQNQDGSQSDSDDDNESNKTPGRPMRRGRGKTKSGIRVYRPEMMSHRKDKWNSRNLSSHLTKGSAPVSAQVLTSLIQGFSFLSTIISPVTLIRDYGPRMFDIFPKLLGHPEYVVRHSAGYLIGLFIHASHHVLNTFPEFSEALIPTHISKMIDETEVEETEDNPKASVPKIVLVFEKYSISTSFVFASISDLCKSFAFKKTAKKQELILQRRLFKDILSTITHPDSISLSLTAIPFDITKIHITAPKSLKIPLTGWLFCFRSLVFKHWLGHHITTQLSFNPVLSELLDYRIPSQWKIQ